MVTNEIIENKKIFNNIPNSLCNRLEIITVYNSRDIPICENGENCIYRRDIGGFNGDKVYICKNPNDGAYIKNKDLN